ncbi:MAG: winged helix-turn-helix transcriptional regulator, partial [Anaerolineales bacterium]|nr:winged helix-turn-helix transcriptional regulator [Anaerolineales bacterium]
MRVISDLFLVSLVQPDRALNVPLYRQIYDAMRLAILDGRIARGAKLPSSRDMATLLQVSRNTILNAVDQ